MAAAEHKSDFELTKDTSYLALMGELWGVCCEDSGENWSHYNGTALYLEPDKITPSELDVSGSPIEFQWGSLTGMRLMLISIIPCPV